MRASIQRAFSERIQAKLANTVWASGCRSWYLKDGHNLTLWPGFTFQYWMQTRALDVQDYQLVGRPRREPGPNPSRVPVLEPA